MNGEKRLIKKGYTNDSLPTYTQHSSLCIMQTSILTSHMECWNTFRIVKLQQLGAIKKDDGVHIISRLSARLSIIINPLISFFKPNGDGE